MLDAVLGFVLYLAIWAGVILAYSATWYTANVYAEFEVQKRPGRTFVLLAADFSYGVAAVLLYYVISYIEYHIVDNPENLQLPTTIAPALISMLAWIDCWRMLWAKTYKLEKYSIGLGVFALLIIAAVGTFIAAVSPLYGICHLCIYAAVVFAIVSKREARKE